MGLLVTGLAKQLHGTHLFAVGEGRPILVVLGSARLAGSVVRAAIARAFAGSPGSLPDCLFDGLGDCQGFHPSSLDGSLNSLWHLYNAKRMMSSNSLIDGSRKGIVWRLRKTIAKVVRGFARGREWFPC